MAELQELYQRMNSMIVRNVQLGRWYGTSLGRLLLLASNFVRALNRETFPRIRVLSGLQSIRFAPMKPRTLRVATLLALGASVVAIYLYPHLPLKRTPLLPEGTVVSIGAEQSEDGKNGIAWIDESERSYRCFRGSAEAVMYYCGSTALLGGTPDVGVDLSGYQWIELSVDYEGAAEILQLFVRHYDPRYSHLQDHNSAKYMSATVRAHELQDVVRIGLNEFHVPEWWLRQYNLLRQQARPEFHNSIAVGFDFAQDIPPGEHRFKINNVEAIGVWIPEKSWYLGILACWLFAIFGLLSHHWIGLRLRAIRDRQRLRELAVENDSLRTESDQFRQLSHVDHLTNVYNRRGFSHASRNLADEGRDELTLILLDIDHFKAINDTHGHEVGDRALKQVADLIVLNTRKSDIVGRWGGEEFTILCAHTDLDSGLALAEKIRRAIASAVFQSDDGPLSITASFGVATVDRTEGFSRAFKRVDDAMYQAKHDGRNRAVKAG